MATAYIPPAKAPTRQEIDRSQGIVLLEFGTHWCGICRALAPHVEDLVQRHPAVRHVKVEDGPGLPLGRSFQVKLWPNLVFLKDGTVLRQLVRPSATELKAAFAELVPTA
jgi:thioredoxin 1